MLIEELNEVITGEGADSEVMLVYEDEGGGVVGIDVMLNDIEGGNEVVVVGEVKMEVGKLGMVMDIERLIIVESWVRVVEVVRTIFSVMETVAERPIEPEIMGVASEVVDESATKVSGCKSKSGNSVSTR